MIPRLRTFALASFLIAGLLSGGLTPALAQPVVVSATTDPDLEQLPILFHHGFNDDGRFWATGADGNAAQSPAEYWDRLEIRAENNSLIRQGIPNYVVQYWARSDAAGFADGDPNATAEEGWAALKTPEEIRTPGQNYNSPDPVDYFFENRSQLFGIIPNCELIEGGFVCTFPAGQFLSELRRRMITSNYNRNGLVEHHAEDFAELLQHVFYTDNRFAGHRQVNIITHSAGGLDTRAALHLLNESDNRRAQEAVSNVVYTAPPFAGSTAAVLATLIYGDNVTTAIFQDPWLRNGAGDLSFAQLLIALSRTFAGPQAEEIVSVLLDAVPKPLGFDVTSITVNDLAADQIKAAHAVGIIRALRELASGLTGFPGEPKVSVDLTPWGAVDNLNRYHPNFHTKQFVTWGEGGGAINLTPSLPDAQASYTADGNCCGIFLNPGSLNRLSDDWAVSNVSARILATPQGGVEELERYPSLWHGNINMSMDVVGMDWARTLISPVTDLELYGPVPTADADYRYYRVGGASTLRFSPKVRTIRDRFGESFTVAASAIEYRLVTYNLNQEATFHDWVLVQPDATISFDDLADSYPEIAGEAPFRFEWRAINQAGGREAVRSAVFSVDATPPSVTLIDILKPGFPDTPEIIGSEPMLAFDRVRRSPLLTSNFNVDHLQQLLDRPATNWIIRNPIDKILRIDFDEPNAIVRYQWDDFFTNPEIDTLLNVTMAFLLEDLTPGPHTLYFEVSDAAGNTTNAVQSISILVDDQPPVVGLNYEPTGGLGFVVGPTTPLEFVAEDVETGRVSGSLFVPGLDPVPVNSNFQLGQTTIADAAAGTDVLGTIVTMQAEVSDGVGNVTNRTFDVYYDYSPPRIELQHVGESVLTSDGTYRTTEASIRIEVRVRDNAGYQLPTWTASQPGTDVLRSGGPFVLQSRDGRPEANGGNVTLTDGVNVIVISVADLVGNTSSLELVIEKVQTLIEDDSNRPIELLSLHIEGGETGGTGPQNVSSSDDGSVFIFDSSRRDHVDGDTNGERDIFVWRNSTLIRANTTEDGGQAEGGESRSPTLSGDGRYAYFASEATNLVSTPTSGVNLYVKDLTTGKIALISRDKSGQPVNLGSAFGRFSFVQMSATYTGRYVFFADRFNGYVDGDENGNLDIFIADLDPDVDGDYFNTPPVIRRVSVASDGSEGTGGGLTGGSRYPSVSRDGLYLAFQTSHTNLFPGDDNDTNDAVLVRFGGVDANGTIDFSSRTVIPLAVDALGNVSSWGSEHPRIDRTGRAVVFTTSANLLASDTNNEGVDNDVYRSTGFLENWQNRVLTLESTNTSGVAVGGRIAPNHTPGVSDYTAEGSPRVAYLADKSAIVNGDVNGQIDLFVHADDTEAINWLSPTIPSTQRVLEGGITPNGMYAWWVTIEEYSTVVGVGTGLDLYRRRIDPESESEAPQIVTPPVDLTAIVGDDVAFSVAASGRPVPTYQWMFNGTDIPGATNATLFIGAVSFEDQGVYSVRVTNEAGSVTSAGARLTVTSLAPAVVVQPHAVEVAEGETAELTSVIAGLQPLSYTWTRNGIALSDDERIVGSGADTLKIFSALKGDAGTYVLTATNLGGSVQTEAVELKVVTSTAVEMPGEIPDQFALHQNYPNPFNPTTQIRYALPQQEHVRLEVFDLLGRRVTVLVDAIQPAGWHTITMDASQLASGTYFYVISAGSFQHARPLTVAK